jgi:PAS domain-containing protein
MAGCMFLHFLVSEVSSIVTEPECAVTACFNIIRTVVLGAAGFIAAGALRAESMPIPNDETSNDDTSHDAAALAKAAEAYDASPTAMAVVDGHRHIEKCNPAFVSLLSRVRRYDGLSTTAAAGVCNKQ